MTAVPVPRSRRPLFQLAVLGVVLVVATGAAASGLPAKWTLPVLLVAGIVVVAGQKVLSLNGLLWIVLLDILFVPVTRYKFPWHLPFDLDPYRIVVGGLVLAWIGALLVDPRVRPRRSDLRASIALVLLVAVASDVVNHSRVSPITSHVIKDFTYFLMYVLLFCVLVSLVRTRTDVDRIVRILVGGGSIVAAFAVIESRTGFNVFDRLHTLIPILQYYNSEDLTRGGHFRALASADHPIALSAMLVCLVPLAVYLCRTRSKIWWLAAFVLVVGNLATASRTGIVMLAAVVLVYVLLRWKEMRRLWPALVPVLIAVHFAVPGALGGIWASFAPGSNLVSSQHGTPGIENGRLSHYWRARVVLETDPVFGNGYGTRITGIGTKGANSPVFDNEWLDTIVDTGLAGVFAWLFFFGRVVTRFARDGKHDQSARGWLLVGVSASLLAFGAGMFFYDAFSFTQVTAVFWIIAAIGVAARRLPPAAFSTRAA